MPTLPVSRHTTSLAYYDEEGTPFLGDRSFYSYRALADNIAHLVVEGDTLQNLAYKYYGSLSSDTHSAAQLWWVIADFQPEPIHDPTRPLTPGTYLVIPSLQVVQTAIINRQ